MLHARTRASRTAIEIEAGISRLAILLNDALIVAGECLYTTLQPVSNKTALRSQQRWMVLVRFESTGAMHTTVKMMLLE